MANLYQSRNPSKNQQEFNCVVLKLFEGDLLRLSQEHSSLAQAL